MITINGKYTQANIMTDMIEDNAKTQIEYLCNHPLFEKSKIVIMPDVHYGKGTVVGLSVDLSVNNMIPTLIGTDIGCGIRVIKIKGKVLNDYTKLDKVVHNLKPIPNFNPRLEKELTDLCKTESKYIGKSETYLKALGSVGSGNHFISLEKGKTGTYLIIHTGSRNLGRDVAMHYMDLALQQNCYKEGPEKQLSWLNQNSSMNYLQDVLRVCLYAETNRQMIAQQILKEMKWKEDNTDLFDGTFPFISGGVIDVPHNYIKVVNDVAIIRKGASHIDSNLVRPIPINMADGTLLVKGKVFDRTYGYTPLTNWNYTLPHGAGRILARSECNNLDMKEYKQRMKGIYSSCVNVNTIDESPMAYKSIDMITESVEPICEIIDNLKPLYNYKQI